MKQKKKSLQNDERRTSEDVAEREISGSYIYAGPSIPRSRLSAGKLLRGSRAEIEKYLASEIALCPQISSLLIPAEELSKLLGEVRENGHMLNQKYNEIIAWIKTGKKED